MKSPLTLSILFFLSFVSSQNNDDWGCNHYYTLPTESCYAVSNSIIRMYTCNGTNTLVQHDYDNIEDCPDGDATSSISISLDDTSNNAECDNNKPCDMFIVTCDGIFTYLVPINVCISFSSSESSYFSCSESILTRKDYSTNDCSGINVTTSITDFSNYTVGDECYEVM